MSFYIIFAIKFSSFRIDLVPNKYLFNTFNLPLSERQNKAARPKVDNENEEDIKNPFNFYQKLDS